MAYSKTPTVDTYSTERISFVTNPQMNDKSASTGILTTDTQRAARVVNMLPTYTQSAAGERTYYLSTRPSFDTIANTANISAASSKEDRGCFYWTSAPDTPGMYYVYGNQVFFGGALALTLTTNTGRCGFCDFLDASGNRKMILSDGTKLYVFTASLTITTVTDVDLPSPHVPDPVFLGGYLFLAKSGTNDIYNSDLNTPTSWQAGNFISAESQADVVTSLVRSGDYVMAIGSLSVEYFYNAGNATGTPLAKHRSAGFNFGTAQPGTVSAMENEVTFVSNSKGEAKIKHLTGFQEEEIGIPIINVMETGVTSGFDVRTYFSHGYMVNLGGQKLYVLVPYNNPFALVYSFETKMWVYWNAPTLFGYTTQFKYCWPRFVCNYGEKQQVYAQWPYQSGTLGVMACLSLTADGAAYDINFASGNTQVPVPVHVYTPDFDFGNMNTKFMYKFTVVGEGLGATASTNVSISWTDNYWYTETTPVTLVMTSATGTTDGPYHSPAIFQLGRFRRRAFHLSSTSTNRIRLFGFEVNINKGNS